MQDNKLIKALVLNAQLGNNSAFEQLYQMTIEQIYTLALRLSGDSTSAEKLTKKTYVNAWQRISEKDEFNSFADWLKKIAVQTVLMEKNGDKNNGKDADETIFLKNQLENHIRDLEFPSRLIFVLHDIENFSLEEISKLSGKSEKEIKTLLANTRENLIKLTEE